MEPDYSKYTTSELLDVLESIGYDEFPERVKLIKSQLEQREVNNDLVEDDKAFSSKEKKLGTGGQVVLIIAALFFVWLSLDAVNTGTISLRRSTYRYETSPFIFLSILAAFIFAMVVCVSRVIKARRISKQ